jgi:hypothetical protein
MFVAFLLLLLFNAFFIPQIERRNTILPSVTDDLFSYLI